LPRPQRPWFRFYVEAVHDRKLRRLNPAQRWLFVAVLAAARQSPIPGYLRISDRDAMTAEDLADFAAVPLRQVNAGIEAMSELGLIEWDTEIASWHVPKWNDRQYESDDVTARTRAHRSRLERSNVVPGNVPRGPAAGQVGTPPETETDTDPLSPPSEVVPKAEDYRMSEQLREAGMARARELRDTRFRAGSVVPIAGEAS
jgi:hypothetical protein